MFVSQMSEEVRGLRAGRGRVGRANGDRLEYQTANELFQIMGQTPKFQRGEEDPLSACDLVLLYKNIDIGSKLMSSSEIKRKEPNQRVETIVYDDYDTESEFSEISSRDDLHHIIMINKDRMDRLNHTSHCHKFEDLEIHTSNMTIELDADFSLKHDLHQIDIPFSVSYDTPLSISMSDYIRRKRMEGNYNISLDNVIRYVNYTIDQLKRISNGEYLTDKAREKWKEPHSELNDVSEERDTSQALVPSTTVCETTPQVIEVPQVTTTTITKWDKIIQPEIDIKTITKILEKKIVIEVSKPLSETLKCLNIYRPKNLFITCETKKEEKSIDDEASTEKVKVESERIDVTLQLNEPETGYLVSSITATTVSSGSEHSNFLSLPFIEANDYANDRTNVPCTVTDVQDEDDNELVPNANFTPQTDHDSASNAVVAVTDSENYLSPVPPGALDLHMIMQRLNKQTPLPEEGVEEPSRNLDKKRSATKLRIKSPYENKSRTMEDKRRKRLLEIKEKREKLKKTLAETTKTKKRQFPRVTSVTKLSITNKSFYDSIYGQAGTGGTDGDQKPKKPFKDLETYIPEETPDVISSSIEKEIANQPEFLDETITEMMYLDMKRKETGQEESDTSSRGLSSTLQDLMQYMDTTNDEISSPGHKRRLEIDIDESLNTEETSPHFSEQRVPHNSPKMIKRTDNKAQCTEDDKNSSPSADFRKSIDKIYELINKRAKVTGTAETRYKSKFTALAERVPVSPTTPNKPATKTLAANNAKQSPGSAAKQNAANTAKQVAGNAAKQAAAHTGPTDTISSVHCTDSGTSLKHCLTSSNPSLFSFEKEKSNVKKSPRMNRKNKFSKKIPQVPKVIISTKPQPKKADGNKSPPATSQHVTVAENPLKAISQLLHEFENVQKSRKAEKQSKKTEPSIAESRSRSPPKVRLREPPEKQSGKKSPVRRPPVASAPPKPIVEEKPAPKPIRKKVSDIFDEIREARGEAVRGPSFQLNARINNLAQPRKNYVQAQIEDFQSRYGRSAVTDRLERLNATKRALLSNKKPTLVKKQTPAPSSPVLDKKQFKKPANASNRTTAFVVNHQKLADAASTPTSSRKESSAGVTKTTKDSPRAPVVSQDPKLDVLTSSFKREDFPTKINKINQMIILISEQQSLESSTRFEIPSDPTESPKREDKENDLTSSLRFSDLKSSSGSGDSTNKHRLETVTEVETIPEEESVKEIRSIAKVNNSIHELKKLQNPLYRHISIDLSFLQSGDANSLAVKSSKFKINDYDKIQIINKMTCVNWPIAQFPMQIATVGYAFPQYYEGVTRLCAGGSRQDNSVALKTVEPVHQLLHVDTSVVNNKELVVSNTEIVRNTALSTIEDSLKVTASTQEKDNKMSVIYETNLAFNINNDMPSVTRDKLNSTHLLKYNTHSCGDNNNEASPAYEDKIEEPNTIKEQLSSHNFDDIDSTNSLDVLVKLLNEIQKITCSQSQITSTEPEDFDAVMKSATPIGTLQQKAHNVISISSLENLRQLESKASSVFSFCVSDNSDDQENNYYEKVVYSDFMSFRPAVFSSVDQEVDAGTRVKKLVHKFTDVPSLFPSMHNHATHVTHSLIGVLSEPSSISVVGYDELNSEQKASFCSLKNVTPHNHKLLTDQLIRSEKNMTQIAVATKTSESKQVTAIDTRVLASRKRHSERNTPKDLKSTLKAEDIDDTRNKALIPYNNVIKENIVVIKKQNYTTGSDYDPTFNFKRDVLVTVYSVLVFTIFAALSIPDILYRL